MSRIRTSPWLKGILAVALVALLAVLPLLHRTVGGLLPGPVDSPGSLQLLALMLISAAAAVTFSVMFGFTGLLSFGHALYFGIGCYATVLLTNTTGLGFYASAGLAVLITAVAAVAGNALSLRLSGIGFSMATLALAQIAYIAVERGYLGTGGEFGLPYRLNGLPHAFVGLANTRNTYWLALGLLVFVYLVSLLAVRSRAGHVWQAIRENPLRANVLGYDVYRYRLASGVFSSTLAGVCGIGYSVVMSEANPSVVVLTFSVSFILMVILGGRGTLWGAVLGGLLYTYLNLRLAAVSDSPGFASLPEVIRAPLSQPGFILGVLFVLIVLFVPGGLASILTGRGKTVRRRTAMTAPRLSARSYEGITKQ
ncbi:branched-chain amino acid ABC transporter permease [Amycolatopsis jejuensis]|uniref:branched-chain amino acid ABC transporter permease n=1 Tax=Amycolatopsis jejuensis TaxID=330084 RepID=UPI000692281B|nr:branched-chain amino acid ABC transporter permease [Amycolatopsis jejuensis]